MAASDENAVQGYLVMKVPHTESPLNDSSVFIRRRSRTSLLTKENDSTGTGMSIAYQLAIYGEQKSGQATNTASLARPRRRCKWT